jgi:hypothetical protein
MVRADRPFTMTTWGQPASAVRRSKAPRFSRLAKKNLSSLLDQTAGGGCPHACLLDRRWWELVVGRDPSAQNAATFKPLAQADHHNKTTPEE